MSNFRQFDRATGFLLPPSLDERLPEQHLARFVVEVIDGLDLSAMVKSYRGSGSASYSEKPAPSLVAARQFRGSVSRRTDRAIRRCNTFPPRGDEPAGAALLLRPKGAIKDAK
jgi:hypothetical protein